MTRRGWIIIGAVIGIVLLAAVLVGWWLQRGGEISQVPILNGLPQAQEGTLRQPGSEGLPQEEQVSPPGGGSEGVTPLPGGQSPLPLSSPLPEAQQSLVVRLQYRTTPTFQITVSRVARTFEVPTINYHAPKPGEPFSVLKIVDDNNQTLSQHNFTLPTVMIFEDFSSQTPGEQHEQVLPQGELDIVLPVPAGNPPAGVAVTTAAGITLNGNSFQYNQLPIDVRAPTTNAAWPRKFLGWLRSWAMPAQAQSGVFRVVVTDQLAPVAGAAVAKSARDMITEVEPWKSFRAKGQMEVVKVAGADMGCDAVPIEGGRLLPGCRNPGLVYRHVHNQGVAFNAIVVAVPTQNNCSKCGAAQYGSRIAGVGEAAFGELIAHEFGHALPGMYDEYLGDPPFSLRLAVRGPNCFSSLNSCQSALQSIGSPSGSACILNCSNTISFRTSQNGLMRSVFPGAVYTPYPERMMRLFIESDIGAGPPQNTPVPSGFYGWFKGG